MKTKHISSLYQGIINGELSRGFKLVIDINIEETVKVYMKVTNIETSLSQNV